MKSGNISVHEWLAKVPDGLNYPQDDDGVAPVVPGVTGTLHVASQSMARDLDHYHSPNDDKTIQGMPLVLDQDLGLPRKGRNRKRQDTFERRPRHKTREDRYEYKGSNLDNQQPLDSKGHKKKIRKHIWHNVNDEFRASNVAQERLTLRSNLNVGIFNKGKASCLVNIRDDNIPGSELFGKKILINQAGKGLPRNEFKDRRTIKRRKKGHSGQQLMPDFMFPECSKELGVETTTPPEASVQAYSERKISDDVHKSIGDPKSEVKSAVSATFRDQEATLQLGEQVESHDDDARSPTPWTWSNTHHGESESSHEMEALLLKGLLSTEIDTCCADRMPGMDYCDLQELQQLLQERKSFWKSETSQEYQINHCSPIIITQMTSNTRFTEPLRNQPEGRGLSCSTDLKLLSPEKVKSFHDSGGTAKDTAEFVQKSNGHRDATYSPEPPERFIQGDLDVNGRDRYNASASINADLLVKMNCDLQNCQPTFQEENLWMERRGTTEDLLAASPVNESFDALLDDHNTLLGINEHSSVNEHASRFENVQDLEFLPQILGDDVSSLLALPRQFDVPSATTHGLSLTTYSLPPGFWRQNKLY